ncbi:MAG: hypothetical protein MK226_03915 [Saprospiraceae bacterium]|nr:hypothetical protein [Saprospiraceae bacterium]
MKKISLLLAFTLTSILAFAQQNNIPIPQDKNGDDAMELMQQQMQKMMEGLQLDGTSPFMMDTTMQWNFMMPFSDDKLQSEEWSKMNEQISKMLSQMMQQFQNEDFQDNFFQFFFDGEHLEPFQLSPENQTKPKDKEIERKPSNRKKKKKRTTYTL